MGSHICSIRCLREQNKLFSRPWNAKPKHTRQKKKKNTASIYTWAVDPATEEIPVIPPQTCVAVAQTSRWRPGTLHLLGRKKACGWLNRTHPFPLLSWWTWIWGQHPRTCRAGRNQDTGDRPGKQEPITWAIKWGRRWTFGKRTNIAGAKRRSTKRGIYFGMWCHKTHLQNLKIKRPVLKHIYQENVCPEACKIIFKVVLLKGLYFIYLLFIT